MSLTANDSVDILLRIRTEGKEQLDSLQKAAMGVTTTAREEQTTLLQLQATMKELSGSISGVTAAVNMNSKALQDNQVHANNTAAGMRKVGASTTSSMTEARHALKGMGEELGVHMPRFVASFLTSIEGVAPVMAAAFSAVAIIGLIEVVPQLTKAFGSALDSLGGMTEAVKQRNKDMLDSNDHFLMKSIENADKIRNLNLIGVSGSAKSTLQIQNEALAAKEDGLKLAKATRAYNEALDDEVKNRWESDFLTTSGINKAERHDKALEDIARTRKVYESLTDTTSKHLSNSPESLALQKTLLEDQASEGRAAATARAGATKAIADMELSQREKNARSDYEFGRTTLGQELQLLYTASQEKLKIEQDNAKRLYAIKSQEKGANHALLLTQRDEELSQASLRAQDRRTDLDKQALVAQRTIQEAINKGHSAEQISSLLAGSRLSLRTSANAGVEEMSTGGSLTAQAERDYATRLDLAKKIGEQEVQDANAQDQSGAFLLNQVQRRLAIEAAASKERLAGAQAAADKESEITANVEKRKELEKSTNREIASIQLENTKGAIERQSAHILRMSQIDVTPGREVQAIQSAYNAALDLAGQLQIKEQERIDKETDSGRKRIDQEHLIATIQASSDHARNEAEEKIAQLQKKRSDAAETEASKLFDAIHGGHGSMNKFIKSQVEELQKQLFVNVTTGGKDGGAMGGLLSAFTKVIPNQSDADGNPTGIGGLFKKTLFGERTPASSMKYRGASPYVNSDITFSTKDLQMTANERLEKNNQLTKDNSEAIKNLTTVLNGNSTSDAGGSGSGGFSSAASTILALVSGGSSKIASVASGFSSVGHAAGELSMAHRATPDTPMTMEQETIKNFADAKRLSGVGYGDDFVASYLKTKTTGYTDAEVRAANGLTPRNSPTGVQLPISNKYDPLQSNPTYIPNSWNDVLQSNPTHIRNSWGNPSWPTRQANNINDWTTRNVNSINAAGTASAAGFGVYEGIRQGGVRGDLTASASLVGGVTSLLGNPAVKSALTKIGVSVGSSIPVIGAVLSAGLAILPMLMGDKTKQRKDQMENEVKGSYDRLTQPKNEQFDISGSLSDIVGAGRARSITINNTVTNTTHIDAIDVKSIVDHWEPISQALAMGVQMNHPVVDAIRQAA